MKWEKNHPYDWRLVAEDGRIVGGVMDHTGNISNLCIALLEGKDIGHYVDIPCAQRAVEKAAKEAA